MHLHSSLSFYKHSSSAYSFPTIFCIFFLSRCLSFISLLTNWNRIYSQMEIVFSARPYIITYALIEGDCVGFKIDCFVSGKPSSSESVSTSAFASLLFYMPFAYPYFWGKIEFWHSEPLQYPVPKTYTATSVRDEQNRPVFDITLPLHTYFH